MTADRPATNQQLAAEVPAWVGTILESCIRDVALGRIASHSSVTPELVREWWQREVDAAKARVRAEVAAKCEALAVIYEDASEWAPATATYTVAKALRALADEVTR